MSSRRAFLTGILAGSVGLSAGISASAMGQAPGQGQPKKPVVIPPMEVVATRRPEATHDVPASIEVITGADLRARGATSLRDALALAAGVAIAPGGDGGPAGSVPEFWGLREFDAFLLVVDGVPWGGAFNPALATLNLGDVDRIEILRGPAPVTYGATSFVGVIHVVHNAAAVDTRTLAAHGGSFGTGGVATDFGIPTSGAWKSRVSVDLERQGFKDDRTDYERGHALWRFAKTGEDRSTWMTGDVTILRQDPASPHPREGPGLSAAVPLDANHNPDGAFLNENRFAVSAGWQRPVLQGSTWGTTLSFTHSTQNMFRGFLTDISDTPNNASGFKENIDVNDLYADTHIIWPSESRVRFMTGADALFANGEAKGATFSYTVPLNGSTGTPVPEPATLDKDAEAWRLFLGAYGSAEWRPSGRLSVSGGLRLNATSERRGEGESVSHARLSGSLGVLVGLVENGADHLRVFATYKNTFKPAAFDFSLAENEGVLDPETSNSYEGGLKGRMMDGRFDFEASVFRMDFENLVTATVVNNLPALINAGSTRFQGFEMAGDLRLPHSVFARATYSFHDGKFVDFVQDFGGVPTQLAGKRFEMSARHLVSAGLSLSPATGFIANADLNYTGNRFLNKRNTALVPGFTTVDAGIGYRLSRAEFRLDGRNLGNRRDAVSESEFGDAQYYRMTARSVRAGLVLNY
jgi:iron complex outermembrane recepter protein